MKKIFLIKKIKIKTQPQLKKKSKHQHRKDIVSKVH